VKRLVQERQEITPICSPTDTPIASHSHGLLHRALKALASSDRALRVLKSWKNTSVVKASVYA
jgi:hypothetical protein